MNKPNIRSNAGIMYIAGIRPAEIWRLPELILNFLMSSTFDSLSGIEPWFSKMHNATKC